MLRATSSASPPRAAGCSPRSTVLRTPADDPFHPGVGEGVRRGIARDRRIPAPARAARHQRRRAVRRRRRPRPGLPVRRGPAGRAGALRAGRGPAVGRRDGALARGSPRGAGCAGRTVAHAPRPLVAGSAAIPVVARRPALRRVPRPARRRPAPGADVPPLRRVPAPRHRLRWPDACGRRATRTPTCAPSTARPTSPRRRSRSGVGTAPLPSTPDDTAQPDPGRVPEVRHDLGRRDARPPPRRLRLVPAPAHAVLHPAALRPGRGAAAGRALRVALRPLRRRTDPAGRHPGLGLRRRTDRRGGAFGAGPSAGVDHAARAGRAHGVLPDLEEAARREWTSRSRWATTSPSARGSAPSGRHRRS